METGQALDQCRLLTHLDLSANAIEDISALEGLQELRVLYLYQNRITDLSPLIRNARNGGLDQGAMVWMTGNPLSNDAVSKQIPELRDRHQILLFLLRAAFLTRMVMDMSFFNHQLYNPLQPDESMLTRSASGVVNVRDAHQLVRMTGIRREHPLLSAFLDPAYGDLAATGFGTYLRLPPGAAPEHERVLASFPDHTPAIIESAFGSKGTATAPNPSPGRNGSSPFAWKASIMKS